jgi:alpha-beta hydrolase superfamily lysophospholipase
MATSAEGSQKTIVLIHGLWITALSWERWVERYEAAGHRVIARSWPGMEVPIADLRRDASAVEHLGPGTAVQPASIRIPGAQNPANYGRAVMLTADEFRYAFGNTLSEEASLAAYERYAVPGPGRVLFQGALANFNPHAATKVEFHNEDRAPLLLIAGGVDHTVPAVVDRQTADHYASSKAVTAYKEFPGRSHWTIAEPGWEEVADYALSWALEHARTRALA